MKNIAPGDYYLQAIESSEGHLVNKVKHAFSIAPNHLGKPQALLLNAENKRASAIFKKVNENMEGLENAEYRLYRKEDYQCLVQDNITSDAQGFVLIEQLSPGNYELEEVKAPKEYLLDSNRLSFTIPQAIETYQYHFFDLGQHINYQQNLEMRKVNEQNEGLEGVKYTPL